MIHSHYAYFAYELLAVGLTDSPPATALVIGQPVPGTYKVLHHFSALRDLATQLASRNYTMVCYSAKKRETMEAILRKALPNLPWIFVRIDSKKFPNLHPNHARFTPQEGKGWAAIEYGEGFSCCQVKQQLLIAIQSALGITQIQKGSVLVFQKDKKEVEFLKKNGYTKLFTQIPTPQQIGAVLQEQCPIIQNPAYEAIASKAEETADTLNTYWGYNYFQDKKTLTIGITGNKPIRTPGSKSICSLLFLFQASKKPYIIKTDLPEEIGGKEYLQKQERKILGSVIYQVIFSTQHTSDCQAYYCLPMQLMHTVIRHSLIKAYDSKKGVFVARPYIRSLKTLAQLNHTKEEIASLFETGLLGTTPVKGIGKIIALSLIMGENLHKKDMLATISLFEPKDCFKNFQEKSLECCKIDFSTQMFDLFTKKELQINTSGVKIIVQKLAPAYLKQIEKTLIDCLNCFPLIQGAMLHPSWSSSKLKQFKILKQNTFQLCKHFKLIDENLPIDKFTPKVKDLGSINPVYINYLIARDNNFSQFTEKPIPKFQFSFETITLENQFIEGMKENANFIVYGALTPIFTLMKWIRAYRPDTQVQYISLIQRRPDYYITRTKVAKNQGKKKVFIVDHCELEGVDIQSGNTIADLNRGFKTIFVYRLQPSPCKRLRTIHYSLNTKVNMIESEEELQKALVFLYDREFQKGNIFKCRYSLILAWIRNKWCTYIQKAGLFTFEELCDALRKLVELIAHKRNRLGAITKNQRFPDVAQRSANSQLTLATYPTSNLTEAHPYLKQYTQSQMILYCLPIYVEQQRVYLIHDFYSFLQAYNLYEDILNISWSGEFQADQLEHFLIWFEELSQNLRKQMVSRIEQCLDRLYKTGLKEGCAHKKCNDCLELLRKIGATQFFSKHEWIQHFDKDQFGFWRNQDSLLILQKDLKFIQLQNIHFKKPTTQEYPLPAEAPLQKLEGLSIIDCKKLSEDEKTQKVIFQTLFSVNEELTNPMKLLNLQEWTHTMQMGSDNHKINQRSLRLIFPTDFDQHFDQDKKISKIVKISPSLFLLFNNQGAFCFFGVHEEEGTIHVDTYKMQQPKQNIKGTNINKIQVVFEKVSQQQEFDIMIGMACESKVHNSAIDSLFITEFRLKLNRVENKIEEISLQNINSHFLPQYGPINCFGMTLDRENNKRSAWVFAKGSDSMAQWVLGSHGQGKFCFCCPLRRIFRLQPDPVYLNQLNKDYMLIGSKLNFVKKMKLG